MLNKSGYHEIPLARLVESPHNPRRRFNEKSLAELAASIEEHGILTPLLARPQEADFEIAAGHRRYRAAKIAGFVTVPVVIRQMTDQQFMEILTVENLQREDVHAYEEAQGYAELLKLPGYDVTAVAAKIGRSESYVRGRLRLLDLVPEVVEEFLNDGITFAHARLITPLPKDKQAKALKQCFAQFGRNLDKRELLPVAELRGWIRDDEGEDLADAPFSLEDAGLVPEAGACLLCPKSTCSEARLFADDQGGETCYDKKCFEEKIEAHIAKLAKSGLVAISTDYNEKAAPAGVVGRKEYTEIQVPPPDDEPEDREDLNPEEKICQFAEQAIIAAGWNKGQVRQICREPKCPIHGKLSDEEIRKTLQAKAEPSEWQKQREADEKKKKAEWAKRRDLYETLVSKWAPIIDRPILFLLVVDALEKIRHFPLLTKIAEELGVTKQTDLTAQRAVIYTWAEKAGVLQLRAAFIRLFFAGHIEREEWDRNYDMLRIASDTLKDELAERRPAPVPAKTKKVATHAAKKPTPKAKAKKK